MERRTFFFPKQASQPPVTPHDVGASKVMVRNKAEGWGSSSNPATYSGAKAKAVSCFLALVCWFSLSKVFTAPTSLNVPSSFFPEYALWAAKAGADPLPATSGIQDNG